MHQNSMPAKEFNQDKVYFLMEVVKTLGNLVLFPWKSVPHRATTGDITVPAAIFLFVGGNFLLMINNLPLFTDPHKSISVHQFIYGTSAYLQHHTFANLVGQYWTLITFSLAGWITLIFALHARSQSEQMYMLGVTLNVISAILFYIMVSYGIGMLLIKMEQVGKVNNILAHFLPRSWSVARIIFAIVLYPLLAILNQVYLRIGSRGVVTFFIFCLLLLGMHQVFAYYFKPLFVVKKAATVGTGVIKENLSVKSTNAGESVHFNGLKNTIYFTSTYHTNYYSLKADLVIDNNLDTAVSVFMKQTLNINLIIDTVLMLKQEDEHSPDFHFFIRPSRSFKNYYLKIPAHSSKKIIIEGTITHATYDYLLRMFRNDQTGKFKATVNSLKTSSEVNVEASTIGWTMKFVNGDVFGVKY